MRTREDIWQKVRGIDTTGPEIHRSLRDLKTGKIQNHDEQIELLVDLYRDGRASTAGYAALPELVTNLESIPTRLAWELAVTAGSILGAVGREGSPAVPSELQFILANDFREQVIATLLETAANAKLDIPELLDTFAVLIILKGRPDLYDKLRDLVSGADAPRQANEFGR